METWIVGLEVSGIGEGRKAQKNGACLNGIDISDKYQIAQIRQLAIVPIYHIKYYITSHLYDNRSMG